MEIIELADGEALPRAARTEHIPEDVASEPEDDRNYVETVPERLRADPGELEIESTEERAERQTLTVRLGRYINSFPQECEGFKLGRKYLLRKSLAALRELADDVKHMIGTRRTGEQMKGLFLAGVNVAEMVLPMVGMDCQGLTNIISQNEDILKTVDEIAIARDAAVYIAPEMRLAAAVGQIILALDSHHKSKAPQEPTPVQREAQCPWQSGSRPDNVAAGFDDL